MTKLCSKKNPEYQDFKSQYWKPYRASIIEKFSGCFARPSKTVTGVLIGTQNWQSFGGGGYCTFRLGGGGRMLTSKKNVENRNLNLLLFWLFSSNNINIVIDFTSKQLIVAFLRSKILTARGLPATKNKNNQKLVS